MTGRPRHLLLTFVAASMAVAACGVDSSDGATPAPVAQAVFEGTGQAMVPAGEAPESTFLSVVERSADSYGPSWVALYGDPSAEDPLAGDLVHVIYSTGNDARSKAREGQVGSTTWVRADTEDDDQEIDEVVVGGTGIDEGTLRGYLDRLVLGDPVRSDGELRPAHLAQDDLGDDLQLLAEGPIDFIELWYAYYSPFPAGARLGWTGDQDPKLFLSAVAADRGASLLARSIIDDPDGTELRGVVGALGAPRTVPPDERKVLLAAWEEDGLLVFVESVDMDRDELEAFIEGLRPTTDGDWPALIAQAEQAPPRGDGAELASGGTGGDRWSATLMAEHPLHIQLFLQSVDRKHFGGAELGSCEGSEIGHITGGAGSFVAGIAPAGATGVVLERTAGPAVVTETRPLPDGRVFWATFMEDHGAVAAVVAHDAAGTVLERTDRSTGFLPETTNHSGGHCLRRDATG